MPNDTLDLLLSRRSVKAADIIEPGPSEEQLDTLLRAAHRVPDHGKIGPWRFVIFQGESRANFGQKLSEIFSLNNPKVSQTKLTQQRNLLLRAPCVIAVIHTPDIDHKIPLWEQQMATGAACQNLIVATHAMGFVGQWLSEWYSYDEKVHQLLGMSPNDKVAGFFYLGSQEQKPDERARPPLSERVQYW